MRRSVSLECNTPGRTARRFVINRMAHAAGEMVLSRRGRDGEVLDDEGDNRRETFRDGDVFK